jgi:hypothetical protein
MGKFVRKTGLFFLQTLEGSRYCGRLRKREQAAFREHAEVCLWGVASPTEIASRSAQIAFDVSHADHESEISHD